MKNFKQSIVILAFAAATTLVSCSKSDAPNPDPDGKTNTLFSEATGWKRVAIINRNNNFPLGGVNWITPYDLNIVDNKAQVVYYQDSNFKNQSVFKASYAIGGNAEALVTHLDKLFRLNHGFDGVDFGDVFFKTNTFEVESLIGMDNGGSVGYTILHNEIGTELAKQLFGNGSATLFSAKKMYSNFDILLTGNGGQENGYYTNATNNWQRISILSSTLTYNIDGTVFKIADGTLLAFRLYDTLNPKQAFLSISDIVQPPDNTYQARFTEEHPEYAPTQIIFHQYYADDIIFANTVKIIGYAVENNSFTVVLREENNTTHNYTLSAFKWTKGAVAFQNLYSHVPVSKLLGQTFNISNTIICQPDGTVATIVQDGINANITYSLATCSATGEHKYGSVNNNFYPRAQTALGCLRYINGSYYAVASPSLFFSENGEGQHLDIVKLEL